MEKIETLYKQCINELNSIGIKFDDKEITIKISKRANKRYGCCKPEVPDNKYKKIARKGLRFIVSYENYFKYTIEISSWVPTSLYVNISTPAAKSQRIAATAAPFAWSSLKRRWQYCLTSLCSSCL